MALRPVDRHLYLAAASAAVLLVAVIGCANLGAPRAANATWPSSPEVLPPGTSGLEDARVACDGRTFPKSGFDAPSGAETASGPEFDALRAALAKFSPALPGTAGLTWRLVGRDDTGATFLARSSAVGDASWFSVDVKVAGSEWTPVGMGGCEPFVVLSPEFGSATWALDPRAEDLVRTATTLNVLVWERSCSSGRPTTGRMSAPVIQYAATTVTITIGVRPIGGGQSCPGPAGTPALVQLSEPLGNRILLDGAHVPPAPPAPPY